MALSAAAWLAVLYAARSMSMPDMAATAADALIFVAGWLVMTMAMMLPSALPMLLLFDKAARSRAKTVLFGAGYLIVWTVFGMVAYAVYALVSGGLVAMAGMQALGRPALAVILAMAGLYQLTPLKSACLRHCRSPLAFIMNHWRDGRLGALRMGTAHGAWCVGCCAGFMVLLFALGVMNLAWMVALAVVILGEKALPFGAKLARVVPAALLLLAGLFALSPEAYQLLS